MNQWLVQRVFCLSPMSAGVGPSPHDLVTKNRWMDVYYKFWYGYYIIITLGLYFEKQTDVFFHSCGGCGSGGRVSYPLITWLVVWHLDSRIHMSISKTLTPSIPMARPALCLPRSTEQKKKIPKLIYLAIKLRIWSQVSQKYYVWRPPSVSLPHTFPWPNLLRPPACSEQENCDTEAAVKGPPKTHIRL